MKRTSFSFMTYTGGASQPRPARNKLLKKHLAARRAAAVRPSAGSSAGGKRKRGRRPRCYTCSKRGHIAVNCTAGGGSDDSSSESSS